MAVRQVQSPSLPDTTAERHEAERELHRAREAYFRACYHHVATHAARTDGGEGLATAEEKRRAERLLHEAEAHLARLAPRPPERPH